MCDVMYTAILTLLAAFVFIKPLVFSESFEAQSQVGPYWKAVVKLLTDNPAFAKHSDSPGTPAESGALAKCSASDVRVQCRCRCAAECTCRCLPCSTSALEAPLTTREKLHILLQRERSL